MMVLTRPSRQDQDAGDATGLQLRHKTLEMLWPFFRWQSTTYVELSKQQLRMRLKSKAYHRKCGTEPTSKVVTEADCCVEGICCTSFQAV